MRFYYSIYNKEFINKILSKEDIIKLDSLPPPIISTSDPLQVFEYDPVKNKNINHDKNKND